MDSLEKYCINWTDPKNGFFDFFAMTSFEIGSKMGKIWQKMPTMIPKG